MITEDDKAKIRKGEIDYFMSCDDPMKEVLSYIKFIHDRDIKALHEEIEILKSQLEKAKK